MAPPDPAQVTSVRSSHIANRTENPMTNRRGPPIGPNTSIKLDENIFRLVKRFSNLPANLHAAEAITVENVRNSWFPMMEQLKRQFPEAFPTGKFNTRPKKSNVFQRLVSTSLELTTRSSKLCETCGQNENSLRPTIEQSSSSSSSAAQRKLVVAERFVAMPLALL